VDPGRGVDVDVRAQVGAEVVLGEAARALEEDLCGAHEVFFEVVLELCGHGLEVLGLEVVEHDDVGAGEDRLARLGLGLGLDLDLEGEAAELPRAVHGGRDRLARPHVVVLEHDHRAEVVAVHVAAADGHRVFLDDAEPGRCFARARNDPGEPDGARELLDAVAARRNARAAGEDVQRDPLGLQQPVRGAVHLRGHELAAGRRRQVLALADEPLPAQAALAPHLLGERHAGQHAGLLHVERRLLLGLADHEPANVERRRVLLEPARDLALPAASVGQRCFVHGRPYLDGQPMTAYAGEGARRGREQRRGPVFTAQHVLAREIPQFAWISTLKSGWALWLGTAAPE